MTTAEIYNRLAELKAAKVLDASTRAALDVLTFGIFQDLRHVPAASSKNAAAIISRMLKSANREALQSTWTDESGRQCACDGFRAYRLKEALPLPVAPENAAPINLPAIFDPILRRKNIPIPHTERGDVKAYIEIQRAEHGRHYTPEWSFGPGLPTVNAVYLFELLSVFPDAVLYTEEDNEISPLYAVSECGDGLLLPLRKAKKTATAAAIIATARQKNPDYPEINLDDLGIIAEAMPAA